MNSPHSPFALFVLPKSAVDARNRPGFYGRYGDVLNLDGTGVTSSTNSVPTAAPSFDFGSLLGQIASLGNAAGNVINAIGGRQIVTAAPVPGINGAVRPLSGTITSSPPPPTPWYEDWHYLAPVALVAGAVLVRRLSR